MASGLRDGVPRLDRYRPGPPQVGYGEARLLGCLATAERAGCDLVTLEALVDDWPRDWYARRGSTEVDRHWMATLLAAPSDVG